MPYFYTEDVFSLLTLYIEVSPEYIGAATAPPPRNDGSFERRKFQAGANRSFFRLFLLGDERYVECNFLSDRDKSEYIRGF